MAEGGQAGTSLAPLGNDGSGGALARISAATADVRGRYLAIPPDRRRRMGASALMVAAICAGMLWYAGRADWRVLFSGLDAKDTQQIAQELSAAGIPYQMTADGSGVEVDADQVEKARIEVATKGMPQSGRMGFELFDKPNWVGSEFDEKVNYQRALEGELEHTIGTLAAVRSARVHIVFPKDSLFGEGQQAAKASVVLQLRRSVMPPEQAEAVRSLVAGAVENLSTESVTLVDADGRLNLSTPSHSAAEGDTERTLEEKLISMLEPTAGGGNVRATVNVAYDEASEQKTDEVFDPSQTAPLSIHKSEQTTGSRPRATGVPGTASNTPGPAATGAVQAGAAVTAAGTTAAVPPLMHPANTAAQKNVTLPVYPQNASTGEGETISEETGSYAVTRHLLHSEQGPGRVRRVTVAVVVNDRMSSEGGGKLAHTVWRPRSPEEMKQLEQLARAAVGFDAGRGDQVVIENVSFSSNVPEVPPPPMERLLEQTRSLLHTQPGLLKALSFAGLSLVLVMAVLRPMTRQMMTALNKTPPLALNTDSGGTQAAIGGRIGGMAFGQTAGNAGSFAGLTRPSDTQAMYEHISEQIRKEPAQSTRLLESWISAPVEEDE